MLALLLTRANALVPVEHLVDELWGGEPPQTAPNVVQGYVSSLRRVPGRE